MAAAPEGLPCHRVVNSQGRTAPGWTRQRELLEAEGVLFRANGRVDLFGLGLGGDRIARGQYPAPAGRFAKKDYGMKRYALFLYALLLAAAVRAATPKPQPPVHRQR